MSSSDAVQAIDAARALGEVLLARMDALLSRIEARWPLPPALPDWSAVIACRWKKRGGQGFLAPVRQTHPLRLADLTSIDAQKARVVANTRQFLEGKPANNALLTGTRGSGKSSLVKALLNEFAREGLRLIEVDRDDLIDLADIIDLIAGRPEKFLIFCDDLSFESGENTYKALKSALDGSIAAPPENTLIYATSNRRHMMPEYFSDNLETIRADNGEIHPGEAVEERVSLSDRFGLWVSFYPFDQESYLAIVARWLRTFGFNAKEISAREREALNWALARGSRSGRVAWQFARDCAGKAGKSGAGRRKKSARKKARN
ncbi:MAG: ATP-binding protein [Zoogloeaceae bacterium]|jgi:predicted AAA+ superfamily ATPase|nr:ATP-binding protein [Zoogloeaceae bacterium]